MTSVLVQFGRKDITFSAIYSPSRSALNVEDCAEILNFHEGSFILGGDFNAKNTAFSSRLNTSKSKALYSAIDKAGASVVSSGEPTYWPSDLD